MDHAVNAPADLASEELEIDGYEGAAPTCFATLAAAARLGRAAAARVARGVWRYVVAVNLALRWHPGGTRPSGGVFGFSEKVVSQ